MNSSTQKPTDAGSNASTAKIAAVLRETHGENVADLQQFVEGKGLNAAKSPFFKFFSKNFGMAWTKWVKGTTAKTTCGAAWVVVTQYLLDTDREATVEWFVKEVGDEASMEITKDGVLHIPTLDAIKAESDRNQKAADERSEKGIDRVTQYMMHTYGYSVENAKRIADITRVMPSKLSEEISNILTEGGNGVELDAANALCKRINELAEDEQVTLLLTMPMLIRKAPQHVGELLGCAVFMSHKISRQFGAVIADRCNRVINGIVTDAMLNSNNVALLLGAKTDGRWDFEKADEILEMFNVGSVTHVIDENTGEVLEKHHEAGILSAIEMKFQGLVTEGTMAGCLQRVSVKVFMEDGVFDDDSGFGNVRRDNGKASLTSLKRAYNNVRIATGESYELSLQYFAVNGMHEMFPMLKLAKPLLRKLAEQQMMGFANRINDLLEDKAALDGGEAYPLRTEASAQSLFCAIQKFCARWDAYNVNRCEYNIKRIAKSELLKDDRPETAAERDLPENASLAEQHQMMGDVGTDSSVGDPDAYAEMLAWRKLADDAEELISDWYNARRKLFVRITTLTEGYKQAQDTFFEKEAQQQIGNADWYRITFEQRVYDTIAALVEQGKVGKHPLLDFAFKGNAEWSHFTIEGKSFANFGLTPQQMNAICGSATDAGDHNIELLVAAVKREVVYALAEITAKSQVLAVGEAIVSDFTDTITSLEEDDDLFAGL